MIGDRKETPNYGNWVPLEFLYIPGAASLLFLILAFLFLPAIVLFGLLFLVSLYFAYARYLFSLRGGNVQDKIHEILLSSLDWDGAGQALDIGCGNAPLTIKLALKYKGACVVGIDYWGKKWEYSKEICE
ncbi:MAG: class I SAM-dependent methyltransferase, partial [Thermodesulfobacteriota bacterium]